MNDEHTEPEVLFERRGQLGHVILNRPRAINALTHGMITAITAQLLAWRDEPSVATVLITGNGERGLCAGGDIVGLYRAATEGDPDSAARFWADEYRMNALIAEYPKPYVAIMDGIVLGGGIGIGAHGSHRIVTERSSLGLPEVGIGFVPDVGSTWLLSRAPGELGTHVALTAGSVGARTPILLGLADALVPSDRLDELVAALVDEITRMRSSPGWGSRPQAPLSRAVRMDRQRLRGRRCPPDPRPPRCGIDWGAAEAAEAIRTPFADRRRGDARIPAACRGPDVARGGAGTGVPGVDARPALTRLRRGRACPGHRQGPVTQVGAGRAA